MLELDLLVIGLALGLAFSPILTVALRHVPLADAADASGVLVTVFQLGQVVGLLTESVGWRAIFWINVPIGVVAFVLAAVFVPESRAPRARRIDPVGQLLGRCHARDADLRDHRGPPRRVASITIVFARCPAGLWAHADRGFR